MPDVALVHGLYTKLSRCHQVIGLASCQARSPLRAAGLGQLGLWLVAVRLEAAT